MVLGRAASLLFVLARVLLIVDAGGPTPDVAFTDRPRSTRTPMSTFYISVSQSKWCKLHPRREPDFQNVRQLLHSDLESMKLYLRTNGTTRSYNTTYHSLIRTADHREYEEEPSDVVHRFFWLKADDKPYSGLLFLKPDFNVLSNSLNLTGIRTTVFDVIEDERGCLGFVTLSYFLAELYLWRWSHECSLGHRHSGFLGYFFLLPSLSGIAE